MNKFQREPERMYIICDIDEILVLQTPKWCKMLYEQYKDDPIMNKYLVLNELLCNKDLVLGRGEYYLNKWLANPDIPLDTVPKEINETILDVTDTIDFYDDLKPTKMGYAIQAMCQSPRVAKIYFVTKNDDGPAWESKKKFMDKYFNFGEKGEMIRVPLDKTKSEYINKYIKDKEKINVIFEDHPKNIIDILDNALQDNKEVVVMYPDYGYGLHSLLATGELTDEKLEAYDNNRREIRVYEVLD